MDEFLIDAGSDIGSDRRTLEILTLAELVALPEPEPTMEPPVLHNVESASLDVLTADTNNLLNYEISNLGHTLDIIGAYAKTEEQETRWLILKAVVAKLKTVENIEFKARVLETELGPAVVAFARQFHLSLEEMTEGQNPEFVLAS